MFRLKITVMAKFTEANLGEMSNVVRDTKCHTGQSFIKFL